MQVWTRIALVLQLIQLLVAAQENENIENGNTGNENIDSIASMEDFIKEVTIDNENLLDGLDLSSQNLSDFGDIDISDITAKITDEINNSDSNVEDIVNSAIEDIMNNIAETNNAQTTQVPTESTVEAFYGEWQEWSECTVSCGNGTRMRARMCFREKELILDITKCEKEDDPDQQGFKETGECDVPECVIETTVNPEDLATIPDPDTFMENEDAFVTEVYDNTEFSDAEIENPETTNSVNLYVTDFSNVTVDSIVTETVDYIVTEKEISGEEVLEIEEENILEVIVNNESEVISEVPEIAESTESSETIKSIESTKPTSSSPADSESNEFTTLPPISNSSNTNTTTLLITVKEVSVEDSGNTDGEVMCDGKRCGCYKNKCWSYCTKLNFLWCWLDDPIEEGKNDKECENDDVCGPNWRCSSHCGL